MWRVSELLQPWLELLEKWYSTILLTFVCEVAFMLTIVCGIYVSDFLLIWQVCAPIHTRLLIPVKGCALVTRRVLLVASMGVKPAKKTVRCLIV